MSPTREQPTPVDPLKGRPLPRLRADLAAIPAYRAGRRPGQTGGDAYSLASNENPFPPSEAVQAAIADAAREAHRYPDPTNSALVCALASHVGVPGEQIALGTGSVALCQQAVTAAAARGDEVVYAWRSFEAYPIIARTAGATPVEVPLSPDGRHDLSAIASAVTDASRVLFLCSPNNPTGPALGHGEVASLLATLPDDLLVVIDEAYHEFVTDTAAVDGIRLAQEHRNVLALRTLSKAHGLAGLRVGYGVGDAELIARLRIVALPFGVSRVAEAAAVAVLREPHETARRVATIVAERERVLAGLRSAGWRVPESQGNFVWLPLRDACEQFVAACGQAGFTVRAFPGEGVRVTVAEQQANDAFLRVAATWDGIRG